MIGACLRPALSIAKFERSGVSPVVHIARHRSIDLFLNIEIGLISCYFFDIPGAGTLRHRF